MVSLDRPVYVQIQNLSSAPLQVFGRSIISAQIQLVAVSLHDPQDISWNALVNALKAGTARVGFPGIGGLAERLVEAALKASVGVDVLFTLQEDSTVQNSVSEVEFVTYSIDPSFWRNGVVSGVGFLRTIPSGRRPSPQARSIVQSPS